MQFVKNTLPYLKRAVWEVKNEEQTQEVKLTESLPDIGKILGAWGQPLIRSKEWRGSGMSVSGGVMVWILYNSEEGSSESVETWIPFQIHWDFPPTQHDGVMRIGCQLKMIDARSISARKMMVRVVVSAVGEALEPGQVQWYQCTDVSQDVQLLRSKYPVCLLTEAGEKPVSLEEELTPKGNLTKILRCNLQPEIVEKKIMADKVVFRGNAKVTVLGMDEEGKIQSSEFEFPFSQYAELEKEYDSDPLLDVIPAVTNLEADIKENGTIGLKAGIIGQYAVYDRPVLELIQDAYSLQRPVTPQLQSLVLPAVLEMKRESFPVETTGGEISGSILDRAMFLGYPTQNRATDRIYMEIPGSFQTLQCSEEGVLQGGNAQWEKSWETQVANDASILARTVPGGKMQVSGNEIHGEIVVDMLTTTMTDIPMVTALELGETAQPDENRPSLILRRAGNQSLWDIAKECGTTVEMLQQANGLSEEPEENQLLLIPVL